MDMVQRNEGGAQPTLRDRILDKLEREHGGGESLCAVCDEESPCTIVAFLRQLRQRDAEVASLRDTIRLTRNVLAASQWTLERSGGVTVSRCELCGATREQGHDEGCTYRDALELLEAAL